MIKINVLIFILLIKFFDPLLAMDEEVPYKEDPISWVLKASPDTLKKYSSWQNEHGTLLHHCCYHCGKKRESSDFNSEAYDVLNNSLALLLNNGFDSNAQNGLGNTALHLALSVPMKWIKDPLPKITERPVIGTKIVKLLIDYKANPYIKNYSNESCVDMALIFPFWKDLLEIMNIKQPFPSPQEDYVEYVTTDIQALALLKESE